MSSILLIHVLLQIFQIFFWKAKHKQVKQICDKVSLAVHRNKTKGKKITASMLLDKEQHC